MKLRFTRRAVGELGDIADFIREHDPLAAARVRASILDSLKTLAAFPRIGRSQAIPGVRKLVARKYPYLIYYTVDEAAGEVVILTIRHSAQARDYSDT
jgi:plasmid stabilization system protein ParE